MPIRQRGERTDARTTAMDGQLGRDGQRNWKAQQKELLHNVVDLRDTVDTDRNVQVAPGMFSSVLRNAQRSLLFFS